MGEGLSAETSAQSPSTRLDGLPYWAIASIIVIATIATRFSAFGNPTYSADDPVFLLVGQAILDGQMPYVDIWDRKPIGIYLIFAGIRLLGGEGIHQSQIVAGLFVAATALTIYHTCRHFASQQASLLAALAYLIFLPMFRGAAAQVSLFYNLPMALAALLVVRSIVRDGAPSLRTCLVAMLLCGVAMTLKQTTAIEGMLFGLALLAIGYKRGWSRNQAIGRATLMVGTALLPTLVSFAAFAWLGHFDDYWFAAFESNSLRPAETSRRTLVRMGLSLLWALPLIAIALWGSMRRRRGEKALNLFLLSWLAVSVAAYAIIPRGHLYYFIPLLLPLAISASTAFSRPRGAMAVFSGLILWVVFQGYVVSRAATLTARANYRALSDVVMAELDGGCLFVAHGPPLLYLTTEACRVSPYVFPNHLFTRVESGATPVPAEREVDRILTQKPRVIVFDTLGDGEFRNMPTTNMLRTALTGNYRSAGRYPQLVDDLPGEYEVWVAR